MKRTKKTLLEIAFVSLFVLTGCSGAKTTDKVITRDEAKSILNTINTNRSAAGFKEELDVFTVVSNSESKKIIQKNNGTGYKIKEDGTDIECTLNTTETGNKSNNTTSYRYSKKYKYVSEKVDIKGGSENVDKIYFIHQFENDTKEYFYILNFEEKTENDVKYKEYIRIDTDVENQLLTKAAEIKEKAIAIIDSNSNAETVKNYVDSLPTALAEGNMEAYRSKNENSVYIKTTGNEGTPIVKAGTTQDTFITRFTDNICVSKYLRSDDSEYRDNVTGTQVEASLTFKGGYTANYPVKPGSFSAKYKTTAESEAVTVKDDENGNIVTEAGEAIPGAYIDYDTGKFLIAPEECARIELKYQYNRISYTLDTYAVSFTEFESAPSNIPLSLDAKDANGNPEWKLVTSF